MTDTRSAADRTAASIETTFEGRWGIWLSGTGRWWAAFRGPLSAADQAAGCVPFLRAVTPDQLIRDIREQEQLRPSATAPPPITVPVHIAVAGNQSGHSHA